MGMVVSRMSPKFFAGEGISSSRIAASTAAGLRCI